MCACTYIQYILYSYLLSAFFFIKLQSYDIFIKYIIRACVWSSKNILNPVWNGHFWWSIRRFNYTGFTVSQIILK